MKIFVLHPENKISEVQRKFMTTVSSSNVFNIALTSNFDECQKFVKSMFADKDFLEGKWGKLYNKSNIPIDVIISPEREVAKSLYRRLEAPGALDNVPFGKNKVKMLEISIEKNCLRWRG